MGKILIRKPETTAFVRISQIQRLTVPVAVVMARCGILIRVTLISIAACCLLACRPPSADLDGYPSVPAEAFDVRHIDLRSDKARQVDFSLHVPLNDVSMFDYYFGLYGKNGWHVCDDASRWVSYSKFANDGKNLIDIRQNSRYMISGKSKEFVAIILHYNILEFEKNNNDATVGHEPIQRVTVVNYTLDDKSLEIVNAKYKCGI